MDPLLICDPAQVHGMLDRGAQADVEEVRAVLYRAGLMQGLQPADAAVLLQVSDGGLRGEILKAAQKVQEKAFGRRVRLSAPVCPTNRCINDCLYCPLRRSNSRLRRNASTSRELQREIISLLDEGHRYVTLVFGDDRSGAPYVRDMISATLGVRSGVRQVRRLDLNINPLRVKDFELLRSAGRLGTYHVFQETYHPETYALLHPDGPKSDYNWRVTCHDRAVEAGQDDVGLGVLLGAYDYRFDVVAAMGHLQYLSQTYPSCRRSISYPRMIAAAQSPASQEGERHVSDEEFIFVVAVTRLAEPLIEIILITPASSEIRRRLYATGVSSVSVGSLSYPGVYTGDGDPSAAGALSIGRPRGLEELVYRMADLGFVPNFNLPSGADAAEPSASALTREAANALLALKEYLMDYASPDTRTVGERLIQKELVRLPARERAMTLDLMEEAEAGLRGQTI